MQGSPSLVCPECGHDAGDPKRLTRTHRHYRRVVAGLVLIAAAWYAMEVSYRVKFENEPISTAAVPTTWYATVYPALDHPTRLLLIERLKRVRGNKTDVWTWQGWLLAKQAARAIERDATDTTIRGDSFDLLAVVVGRTTSGGNEVLRLLKRDDISEGERTSLIGCASTHWGRTHDWVFVTAIAEQLQSNPDWVAPGALSAIRPSEYARADDAQLQRLFALAWPVQRGSRNGYMYWDRLLSELINRPKIAEPLFAEVLPKTTHLTGESWPPRALELLAAYRRVRNEPAPLGVTILASGVRWPASGGTAVQVAIRSTDAGTFPVNVQFGGDNRGPRHERFRFVITDERGVQVQKPVESINFGGISSFGPLNPSRPIEYTLDLSRYTRRPPPGRYQLRVQYHDRHQIAAMEDVSGLIIFESEPVELLVE